jgi:hypothetical protein
MVFNAIFNNISGKSWRLGKVSSFSQVDVYEYK